jgi:hypothetical protein
MPPVVLENPTMAPSSETQIADAISQWWQDQQLDRSSDPFAGGTLYDVLTDVDSLSAVNVLLVLEPIAGISLPESIIKPGGYHDCQEMIDQLVPAIIKLSKKRTT